jgi:hypothetical protein
MRSLLAQSLALALAFTAATATAQTDSQPQTPAPAQAPAPAEAQAQTKLQGLTPEHIKAACRTMVEETEKAITGQAPDRANLLKKTRECINASKEAQRIGLAAGSDYLPIVVGRIFKGGELNWLSLQNGRKSLTVRASVSAGISMPVTVGGSTVLLPQVWQPKVVPFVNVVPIAFGTAQQKQALAEPTSNGWFFIIGNASSTYEIAGWYLGVNVEQASPKFSELRNYTNRNVGVYTNVSRVFEGKVTILVTKYDTHTGGAEGSEEKIEAMHVETDVSGLGMGFGIADVLRMMVGPTAHNYIVQAVEGATEQVNSYFDSKP